MYPLKSQNVPLGYMYLSLEIPALADHFQKQFLCNASSRFYDVQKRFLCYAYTCCFAYITSACSLKTVIVLSIQLHNYPPITEKEIKRYSDLIEDLPAPFISARWGNPVKCLSQRHNK